MNKSKYCHEYKPFHGLQHKIYSYSRHFDRYIKLHNIWNEDLFELIVAKGNLNFIKFAHGNQFPYRSSICSVAAKYNNVKVLSYLCENKFPISYNTCNSAAVRGKDCFLYLLDKTSLDHEGIFKTALINNNEYILNYMIKNHVFDINIKANTICAAKYNKYKYFKILLKLIPYKSAFVMNIIDIFSCDITYVREFFSEINVRHGDLRCVYVYVIVKSDIEVYRFLRDKIGIVYHREIAMLAIKVNHIEYFNDFAKLINISWGTICYHSREMRNFDIFKLSILNGAKVNNMIVKWAIMSYPELPIFLLERTRVGKFFIACEKKNKKWPKMLANKTIGNHDIFTLIYHNYKHFMKYLEGNHTSPYGVFDIFKKPDMEYAARHDVEFLHYARTKIWPQYIFGHAVIGGIKCLKYVFENRKGPLPEIRCYMDHAYNTAVERDSEECLHYLLEKNIASVNIPGKKIVRYIIRKDSVRCLKLFLAISGKIKRWYYTECVQFKRHKCIKYLQYIIWNDARYHSFIPLPSTPPKYIQQNIDIFCDNAPNVKILNYHVFNEDIIKMIMAYACYDASGMLVLTPLKYRFL